MCRLRNDKLNSDKHRVIVIITQKFFHVNSHYFYYCMYSKCFYLAEMQAIDVDATR